jgi:hypothetical protein
VARGVVVLADGLRPDALTPALCPAITSLASAHTAAACAVTVRPSVTVAALTSLATGVSPATHRLTEPGLGFLGHLGALRAIPHELARRRLPTLVVAGAMAPRSLPLAWALCRFVGVTRLRPVRGAAPAIARTAWRLARGQPDGLTFVYLPDCDAAGHRAGWMSPPYLDAVAAVDEAVDVLRGLARDSLLVVTADHGGGGVRPDDHDLPHPVNDAIPLILAGPGVRRRHVLEAPARLLDIPPSLLWYLGVPVPAAYEGRILKEAFEAVEEAEAAA